MFRQCLIVVSLLILSCSVHGQNDNPNLKEIKLKKRCDASMVHFKNGDYILSFNLLDLNKEYDVLGIPSFDLNMKDTLELKKHIAGIDSTGKGNQTNDYKLNSIFQKLLNKGKTKIYSVYHSKYLVSVNYQFENVPGSGEIHTYLDEKNMIIEFYEAFIGTPGF